MDDNEKQESSGSRINDAYGAYKNAKNLMRVGRAAASAARTVGALFATSEIWVPAVVIGVFIFTFIIVLGGPAASSETPSGLTDPGVVDSGTLRISGATAIEIEEINHIFSLAFASSKFKKLLTERGPINVFVNNSQSCSGLVDRGEITLFGFSQCPESFKRYLIYHEAGHIIHARNGALAQTFDHLEYVGLDSGCYDPGRYLITYRRVLGEASSFNESLAEAISLYLLPEGRGRITNFQSQCQHTYNWVRNNIFNEN